MAAKRNTAPKDGRKHTGGKNRSTGKKKPGASGAGRFLPPGRSRAKSFPSRGGKPKAQRGGFLKAACVSAVASFIAFSHLLNPGWFERLGLERFDLGRIASAPDDDWQAPLAVARDGHVQTAFSQCPQFFPKRPPAVPAGGALRELCFSEFAILHDGRTRTPVFVAQRLNRRMLEAAQGVQRTDRFYAEARLPQAERAELSDYRGSGYSRGHMAPAGDMSSDEAMAQSFSLANMVPQDQTHNAGAWNKIESDTRKYVMRARGDVYVFTGPVYGAGAQTMGDGRVAVPTHLYKLVFDADAGRSWVHWQANRADAKPGRPISYDEFIGRTGLHLLPQ